MSKYKIPATSSTQDPYALERSIAGDTLKPTANPISTSTGTELETLTPFQIEEGKGFLGNSQYQQQAQLNQLANDEDFWSLTAKGLKNLAGTVVTEIGKTPGYIGGGLAAVGNELFSDGKDSMKMMVDNSWVNAFESMDQSIKDFMPVNISKEVQEGGLGDKLSSGAWWATTGAEGVGFLLAMYGPGALLKAGKVGQRIMGGIESLANQGVDVANYLNLPIDTLKPYKMSLNTARNVDGYTAAISNSVIESAAEAANTFDNIKNTKKQEYLNQGLPEDQAEQLANQDAGRGAAAVFKTNMIILPVSNLLEEKWLWKSVGLSGQDEAAEGLINQFMKNGVLDVEGLKQATKKTFKEQAGTYSKNFLKNFAKEGGGEEGLQTVTQQQVEKGNIKDNALEQFWNSITSYTDDFENNKELHESIALGGLLGGGASIFTSINEARNNEEAIYGSKQGKFDGILNKIGLRQERKDQRGLSNLLKENWINNFKSYEDLLTDGKLDQEKLVKLPQEQQSLANLHFLYDASVQTGDKLTQNIVGQYLATNYAQPFLGQVGGKEIFQQHVENQVVPEWVNRFKNLTGRDATNIEINEFKKRFLESANPVFDNYNKVEDTHYPERYYQDKENPTRYKEFKDHYFKQKLQALTNVTAADKQIAEATTKITIGDNLTGIQKTNNKIAESEIETANKIKKEAADYYESLFTKKGVKELYDLYSKQEDTVAEVLNEVQQDQSKDAVVAEQKIAEIKNVEQQLDNSIDPDKPLTVKTKDGQLLDVMVDADGKKYVLDNGNVREISGEDIIQNDIKVVQPEDLSREKSKSINGVEPEYEQGDYEKVRQLAKDTINGSFISSPENIQTLSNYPKLFEKYIIEESTNIPEEDIDEKQHEAFLQNDLGTGLYPSTGVHVQYEYSKNRIYDKLDSNGLPLLNDSKHQRTWFETLDKIKNIDEYQVKVVNRTNANESELRVILANSDSSLQDNDLFIFLYQNDKPVTVNNNIVFSKKPRASDEKSIQEADAWKDNTYNTLLNIAKEGNVKTLVFADGREITLRPTINGFKLEVAGNTSYDSKHSDPRGKNQMALLLSDGFTIEQGSNPVFTSLYRPDTLYKDTSKQGISPRLAPQSVLNSFLNSIGISNKETLELSELSDQELNKLESVIGKSNMNDSGLWRAAVQWAKQDYTEWYNSLQQPNTFLQPVAITNGKRLIRRNQDRSIVWNPVKNNIPDFSIKNQKLVNGDLVQQYTPQGIQVGDKFYKLRIGDTAIVSNNQLYRLKQSNINQSEAKTVLYLLSLKDLNASSESIKLPVRTVIKQRTKSGGYNNKTYTETPVFGSNTEYGIIKSLINFSYGQTKGSIYLNGNNVEYVDWNGNLQTVSIQQIQNAFLDDDFSNIQNLLDFLQQKKFNVNENLLRADSDFQYPKLVRTSNGGYNVEFENKGKYKAYLLEDEKLLTDSVIAEGYPKRLARNLQFAKQPTIQLIEESKVEKTEGNNIVSFSNIPISVANREEGKKVEVLTYNTVEGLPVGTVITNSDGEIKVITQNSTGKNGTRTIAITTFERNEDGSLQQITDPVFLTKDSEGNIKSDYNPHSAAMDLEGNRVIMTDNITNDILDLSKEKIFVESNGKNELSNAYSNFKIRPSENSKTVDPRLERLKNRKRTELPDLNAFSKTSENDDSIVASEKTIRDLAARMSDRIGIPVKFESDRTKEYKGKIENNAAYVNLAYATLDTPIHEILGHPIIRAIKNKNISKLSGTSKTDFTNLKGFGLTLNSKTDEWEVTYTTSGYDNDRIIVEKTNLKGYKNQQNAVKILKDYSSGNKKVSFENTSLYQNLLKELEYGKGKEVLDRVKRDYNKKTANIPDWYKHIDPEKNTWVEQIQGLSEYWHSEYSQRLTRGRQFDTNEELEKLLKQEQEKYNKYYTLEEQQEEAIVELLGLMTAEKLNATKEGKLISLLKRLLKEIKAFIKDLLKQREVEIDKLPDNMTLGDLSDLLAYSNSKLILPGNEVIYTTPDNQTFRTYQEASNHVSILFKNNKDVDLSNIDLEESKNPEVKSFIEKNKEYEQSKEIIEEWKRINNIQYNPNEVYSRGQEFSSVVGAYSSFDVNLMMQNLLQHIEDNERAGGKFAISAFTKPIDKKIGHLEDGGGKIKFKIYPKPEDILWATDQDAYSGSVWDASEKINKNKKSELLGVSYTKYPSLKNIDAVQPNLASIIDNLKDHHNELGVVLTGNNFRLEYDDNIPYQTKKILNSINAILDQKYGRLVKPKIDKVQKEPKLLQWKISPAGPGSKTEWALEYLYSDNFNDYSGDVKFFDTKEEAELFVKTLDKKSNQQIGVQPIQTNETLKESINSVVQKVSKYGEGRLTSSKEFTIVKQDEYNNAVQKGIKGFALGTIEFGYSETYEYDGFIYTQIGYDPSKEMFISEDEFQSGDIYGKIKVDNKEYLSQALINTKIAKLKEVAKKYPRSLIRSEVRRIGYSSDSLFDMFEDELPFSKITKEESPLRKRIEELKSKRNKNLPNLNADKIFSPTDMLKQKLLNGEITKYCK